MTTFSFAVPWWDTGRNAVRERILSVDSPSQAALWRYVLHSNASRMTPTAWQRRHLPAGGGGGAWLATFVSPLYVDGPDCGPADGWRLDGVAFDWAGVDAVASAGRCDHCGAQRSHVKRCGRCRAVKYCGVPCQRAHWPRHKTDCRSWNGLSTWTYRPNRLPTSSIFQFLFFVFEEKMPTISRSFATWFKRASS